MSISENPCPSSIYIALVYDFDDTLSAGNMQEYGFMPRLNQRVTDFWKKSEQLEKSKKVDRVLSYMWMMSTAMREAKIDDQRAFLKQSGEKIEFFPGVKEWFPSLEALTERLNDKYGIKAQLEHYAISSGNEELINGCAIVKHFKKIYASRFHFDDQERVCWPAQVVNYTTKTQYLFRINKGALDHDDEKINTAMSHKDRRIPFDQMIFLGDGMTDIPCFRTVKSHGGYSLAVCRPDQQGLPEKNATEQIKKLIKDGRIMAGFGADYREGRPLHNHVCNVIERIVLTRKVHAGSFGVLDAL